MASVSEERDKIFEICKNNIRIQLTTPIGICIKRDVKGLYKQSPDNLSGVNFKYEKLREPQLELDTSVLPLQECIGKIMQYHLRVGSV
jgi:adenylylsulfate kinase-like enzyme